MRPVDVINDPPQVHEAPRGVWRTERKCYEYMATFAGPGSRTMEVGAGVSTVLLAAWGCEHLCVVASEYEADVCKQYLTDRGYSIDNLSFAIGSSANVLPELDAGPRDLYFIDGCHGFPYPVIDWFYGARWLREGGVLIVDDMQLPPVARFLGDYLDADPRWDRLVTGRSWAAYERLSEGPLGEEWPEQGFLGPIYNDLQAMRSKDV